MTAVKPRLSRQYLYAPLANLDVDLSTANVHQIAFKADAAVEPEESDWLEAMVVTSGHDLFKPEIGDALVALTGPERGDPVTTEDLAAGRYLVWTDWSVPGSDARIVDWHGFYDIVTAPGDEG